MLRVSGGFSAALVVYVVLIVFASPGRDTFADPGSEHCAVEVSLEHELLRILTDARFLEDVASSWLRSVPDSESRPGYSVYDSRASDGLRLHDATRTWLWDRPLRSFAVLGPALSTLRDLETRVSDPNLRSALDTAEVEILGFHLCQRIVDHFDARSSCLERPASNSPELPMACGAWAVRAADIPSEQLLELLRRTGPLENPLVSSAILDRLGPSEPVERWLAKLSDEELIRIARVGGPFRDDVRQEARGLLEQRAPRGPWDEILSWGSREGTAELVRTALSTGTAGGLSHDGIAYLVEFLKTWLLRDSGSDFWPELLSAFESDPNAVRVVLLEEPSSLGDGPYLQSLLLRYRAEDELFVEFTLGLDLERQAPLANLAMERIENDGALLDLFDRMTDAQLRTMAREGGAFDARWQLLARQELQDRS